MRHGWSSCVSAIVNRGSSAARSVVLAVSTLFAPEPMIRAGEQLVVHVFSHRMNIGLTYRLALSAEVPWTMSTNRSAFLRA